LTAWIVFLFFTYREFFAIAIKCQCLWAIETYSDIIGLINKSNAYFVAAFIFIILFF